MIELTSENIAGYLKNSVFQEIEFLKGIDKMPVITEIEENTNVNYIFRLEFGEEYDNKILFLKQARHYIKKNQQEYSAERIYYEYKALLKFEQILGEGVVPHVYFFDHSNYVLVMSDIEKDGKLFENLLNKGDMCARIARSYGTYVGKLHKSTYNKTDSIRDPEAEKDIKKFMLGFFKTNGARKFDEEAVETLLAESSREKSAILGVDFTSKNIFVEDEKIRFFDFEGVFRGDPAFDIAHALSDVFLRAENDNRYWEEVEAFVSLFLEGYRDSFQLDTVSWGKIEFRAVKYLGLFMLHRTDGISKFRFLSESAKEKIRKHALAFLKGKHENYKDAIILCKGKIS